MQFTTENTPGRTAPEINEMNRMYDYQNQHIDEHDALGQCVDAANRKIPELVKFLEYYGYTVTEVHEGDLVTDPSVTIGDYYIQILTTGEYSLAHKCADGKIQYWSERQHTAEVLADLDKAVWGEALQTVVAAVEALRDLVGGEAKIEYEWLDDDGNPCRMVTTIDEHLEEIRDCIDPDICPLDPLTVSSAGVWCERHRRWQYAVCGKTDGAVSKRAVMDHYAALRYRPGDDAPGLCPRSVMEALDDMVEDEVGIYDAAPEFFCGDERRYLTLEEVKAAVRDHIDEYIKDLKTTAAL